MAKPIHSMIRVLDEARSVAFYEAAFGLAVVGRFPLESFTLVYMASPESPFELELTINHGRTEPYVLGDGYGHLAVSVEDVDAVHASLVARGLTPGAVKQFELPGGGPARFFFIEDPDGYKIEVLARKGRFL